MPLYEYECENCGKRFEQIQKFSDPPVDVCPKCGGGPIHKLMSSPAIQFKGSGWYITDYARKDGGGGKTPSESGGTAKTDGNQASDSKTGEAKPEPKAEPRSDTKSGS